MEVLGDRELSSRAIANRHKSKFGKSVSYMTVLTRGDDLVAKGWATTRCELDDDGPLRFFRLTPAGLKFVPGFAPK